MKQINSFAAKGVSINFLAILKQTNLRNFCKLTILLATVVFSSLKSFAADGDPYANHIKRQYTVSPWGHTRWGLEYLPDNFYTSTEKYPVIVFFHGTGETGGSEWTLNKLTFNGPSNFIANANYNMQFTNPNTGEVKKFIYIAMQDPYWSPDVNEVWYVLKNNPRLKDRISNVFYTGLSAGGQQTMSSILTSQEMANGITGIVPMSSAGWAQSGLQYARNSPVKAWCFHGLSDGVCGYSITSSFNDSLGSNKSKWTQLPPTHGNWNMVYTKDYRELINGKMMNIYEWMLSLIGPNQAPIANAGPDQSLGLLATSTTLNGDGLDPDGLVSSYTWVKLAGPAQFTILNVANPITAITNLTIGTYIFELTVTDNLGAIGKDTVMITENIITVPVKLSDFKLKENSGNNLLQWKTSNEINSDYFTIERSSNARTFESIGRVSASGNSSTEKNYSFTDQTPLKGVNYYRLRTVDKDGNAEYSKIIATTSKGGQAIELVQSVLSYGRNNVSMIINSDKTQTANLAVIDAAGRVLLNVKLPLQKGVNSIEHSIPNLTKAIYYLKLFTEDASIVKPVAGMN